MRIMINCILAGVGGQGTILASKLIAQAAISKNIDARTAETIGMAQRGGCVVSHVRIANDNEVLSDLHSPLIVHHTADVLIGFEPAEAVRCLSYLKPNGFMVVNKKAIPPVTASLSGNGYNGVEMLEFLEKTIPNLLLIDGEEICLKSGSSKVLNIALLGAAAASGMLKLSVEDISNAIIQKLASKYVDMNLFALSAGAKCYSANLKGCSL